jgi:hypothetical protein
MLVILFVGLGAIAWLAVWLKRRHNRNVESRSVTTPSGISATQARSTPDIGHGREMWGPHQHMAHTGGWEYTSEQDRAMREASTREGTGVLGSTIGKAKSLKGHGSSRLGKKSRSASRRSSRYDSRLYRDRNRGEQDENSKSATASIRRSKSERRRQREARDGGDETRDGRRRSHSRDQDDTIRKGKQRVDKNDI